MVDSFSPRVLKFSWCFAPTSALFSFTCSIRRTCCLPQISPPLKSCQKHELDQDIAYPHLPPPAAEMFLIIYLSDQPNLEVEDCSQYHTEAFEVYQKKIHICSFTYNPVSLHRPGMLWLHNPNLNTGRGDRKEQPLQTDDNYQPLHSSACNNL